MPRGSRAAAGPRRPILALAVALIVSGVLVDGPALRARTLRAICYLTGRSSTALRRISLATGLRYIDVAYPPEPLRETEQIG